MNNATFRKNVLKTLDPKTSKLGLRYVLKNAKRVNTLHMATGLASATGDFMSVLSPYLTGAQQLKDQMKLKAFMSLGNCAYHLMGLSKQVRYSPPGSGKKLKIKDMTRTEAVFKMNEVANNILALTRTEIFGGPVMTSGVRKRKSGTVFKETEVQVIDAKATDERWEHNYETQMQELLAEYSRLLWGVCFSTFEVPPANLFVAITAKLVKLYPAGDFDLSEVKQEEQETETA